MSSKKVIQKVIGGSQQKTRTITQREVAGHCIYCDEEFTKLMFPGPPPQVCSKQECQQTHQAIKRQQAKERMRKNRELKKEAKKEAKP